MIPLAIVVIYLEVFLLLPSYVQILASPWCVHALPSAITRDISMTTTPNMTHNTAGNFARVFHLPGVSFAKQAAGKMKAKAVAETPPVISSATPRSHVNRATSVEATRIVVVNSTCRCKLKGSWGKKYCSMTSRQTKSSNGRVVNMLSPKQKRATLMSVLSFEKLFNMFPIVLSVKTTKADIASVQHATREIKVEM